MRLRSWGRTGIRCAIGAALVAYAMVGVFSLTGHARQSRTVTAGVYSGAQAVRGQELYKTQCLLCHGETLTGVVGPMLTGDTFLAAWGGRPLTDLVDKIQNTMPLQAPKSLTSPQAIDLAAYILQAGKFPAGQAELSAAMLPQVTFPAVQAAAGAPAAGGVTLTPVANLAAFMRGVTFPNANIFFNVQVKDPGAEKPRAPVPFDYVLWGQTVYYGWQAVDQAAFALQETTPLFLLPGRRCENGKPVPLNDAIYKQTTQGLIDLSKELYRAAQSRNQDAVVNLAEKLNQACDACHKVYRDVGGPEGGGLGTDRCNPVK